MSIYCPDHLRDILIAIVASAYISHGIYIFILGVISALSTAKKNNRETLGLDIFLSYSQGMTWPLFYLRMWQRARKNT